MKIRIPTAVIGSSLQVAAALNTSVSDDENNALQNRAAFVHPNSDWRTNEDLQGVVKLSEQAEVTRPTKIPVPNEWNRSLQHSFEQLAEKEALGSATADDLQELEALTVLRRQVEMPRSGDEILREYEQGQLVRNLLNSLTKYVEFEQATNSTSSARSRAPSKA